MSLKNASNLSHNMENSLRAFVQAQFQTIQMLQQSNQAYIAAFDALARAIAAPRRLITDEQGRPIGTEPIPLQPNQ